MTAILTQRVQRNPRSLAPYWYYLNPGDVVHVIEHRGTRVTVSTRSPHSSIADDIFTVPADVLQITEAAR